MAAKGTTIASTEFPLYTLRLIGDRHLLVAGGGGAAKTGVANAIDIFELKRDEADKKALTARKVTHHETELRAVMSCAVARQDKQFVLAASVEGSCQLYSLRYKVITPKVENEVQEGLRKRKGNLTQSNDHRNAIKMVGFEIEQGEEVLTDTSKDKGFQKVVRFNKDCSQIITAGADGYFRSWEYPSLTQTYEVLAHANEVDDLDLSPDGTLIVTVSKDNHIYLWNAADGTKVQELKWPSEVAYRARNCRFSTVTDAEKLELLYTIHIASVRSKRGEPSYIIKWDARKGVIRNRISVGTEILSALAVSDNGIYVAVGTISGSVMVYTAFNLQRVYRMSEVHRYFVTGLEFMPSSQTAIAIAGDYDFTLFSISADNQVKVHQLEKRDLYNPLWALIGFCIIIFLIYWFLTAFEIGL